MTEILEQVRDLIQNSDRSRYAISKATGITESQLSRLMAGTSSLSLDRLELLLGHLGYELKAQKKRGK
ncbi:MAG: helix-turn-helix domain-containing protein [Fuerstiella sp.]